MFKNKINQKYKLIDLNKIKNMSFDSSVINKNRIEKVIKSRRRTVTLEVTPSATLILRLPINFAESKIPSVIKRNEKWLKEKIELMENRKTLFKSKTFTDGDNFLYLGKNYKLQIIQNIKDYNNIICGGISKKEFVSGYYCLILDETNQKIYVFNEYFKAIEGYNKNINIISDESMVYDNTNNTNNNINLNICSTAQNNLKLFFENFYKQKAFELISERSKLHSTLNNLHFKRLKLSSAEKRWGSCSFDNSIRINWRLMMAPINIIDYVIIHELSHTIHKNHSKSFWSHVGFIIPDYKISIKWLKDNGYKLKLD
ncbi:MAG: M48 family metallopeptidase [bacterium]